MNQGLFKDDEAIALDDVTAHAGELLELCDSLERGDHAVSLLERVAEPRAVVSRCLDALIDERQARGDLPAVGNIERAQFGALGVTLESFVTAKPDDEVVHDRLHAMCMELNEAIERAISETRDAAIRGHLESLRRAIQEFRIALDARDPNA